MQLELEFKAEKDSENESVGPKPVLYSMKDYISNKRPRKADDQKPCLNATDKYIISLPISDLLKEEKYRGHIEIQLYIQKFLIGYANTNIDESKTDQIELFTEQDREEISKNKDKKIKIKEGLEEEDPYDKLLECYGSVYFELILSGDSYEETYFSEQVKIGWDLATQEDIDKMIQYIGEHQPYFLQMDIDDNKRATGSYNALYSESGVDLWSSISKFDETSRWLKWSTYIQLAEKIANTYENVYGYFRTKPLTCIKKMVNVSDIEKLSSISPATLQYIPLHPEALQQVNTARGIHIKGRTYQPQETMSLQNVKSRDTYENRIVLGFLQEVIKTLNSIKNEIQKYRDNSGGNEEDKILDEMLSQTLNKIIQLFQRYNTDALQIPLENVSAMPRGTDIFLSVHPYHDIFLLMKEWFDYKMYNLNKEELFVPLTRISMLYERYFLTLLIQYFHDKHYQNEEYSMFKYKPPTFWEYQESNDNKNWIISKEFDKWDYRNTDFNNTFHFNISGTDSVTLYYQPVIYGLRCMPPKEDKGLYKTLNKVPDRTSNVEFKEVPDKKPNGISLYRNNGMTFSRLIGMYNGKSDKDINEEQQNKDTKEYLTDFCKYINNTFTIRKSKKGKDILGASAFNFFYLPDYLIKYEYMKEDKKTGKVKPFCKYMIFDTKFKNKDEVESYDIKELVYKYIVSLSHTEEDEKKPDQNNMPIKPDKLCLVYGYGVEKQNAHIKENFDFPYVSLLPIHASEGEEHIFQDLDVIISSDFLKSDK